MIAAIVVTATLRTEPTSQRAARSSKALFEAVDDIATGWWRLAPLVALAVQDPSWLQTARLLLGHQRMKHHMLSPIVALFISALVSTTFACVVEDDPLVTADEHAGESRLSGALFDEMIRELDFVGGQACVSHQGRTRCFSTRKTYPEVLDGPLSRGDDLLLCAVRGGRLGACQPVLPGYSCEGANCNCVGESSCLAMTEECADGGMCGDCGELVDCCCPQAE